MPPLRSKLSPFHNPSRLLAKAAVALALGWGCGEPTAPPAPVATVALTPTAPVDVVPGGSIQLSAVAKDAAGNVLTNRITTWTSSDPDKVSVAAGMVTGITLGSATITATVEGQTATVSVGVKDGGFATSAGTSFSAQGGAVSVVVPSGAVSQSMNITVTRAASPPTNPRVLGGTTFDLGPGAAATFAQPVTVTLKYDPSTITSSAEAGLQLYEVVGTSWRVIAGSTVNTQTRTVSGNVTRLGTFGILLQANVETVTVTSDLTPLPVLATRQMTASVRDNEGIALTRPVSWSSSNPLVLSVDAATGVATAKLPGTVTITASSETKTGTATLTVVPGPPAKLVANSGNGQSAAAGAAVASPPSVKVTDAQDNPIAGIAVTFAVATGGGTITGAAAVTNASGIATVGSWTLGTIAGPNTLTATSASISGAI
ncbi:MAG TPA: Ig-like domain-containing protein, partial [Gemmatimonadaceae bacterium]|nr:Ig-like domain-containing protein [Gemmatimonadaceae bacterium]